MLTFALMIPPQRGFFEPHGGVFLPVLLEIKTVSLLGLGRTFDRIHVGVLSFSDKFGQTFRVNRRKNGNAEIGEKTLKYL